MGQRANLAIGTPGCYELYYSHWCANTLPRDLFWGPEHALEFVKQQRRVDAVDGWLDTIWAEGGAVIDWQNRKVLLYGGEDLIYDVPLRRLFLKLLDVAWDGWTVRWAFEGIVEIAEYLGVDRGQILADSDHADYQVPPLTPPEERDWLRCIGTFKRDDGLKIYPLDGLPIDYVLAGPRLIAASDAAIALSSMDISEWTSEFPAGGFHVDLTRRQLDFWIADDCPNTPQQVEDTWKDWRVNWHKDCFESQLTLTDSRLMMNHKPQSQLLADLLELLDQDSKPVDILGLAERLSEHQGGGRVEVNPFAIRDDRIPVDAEHRKAFLARCVAAIDEV